MIQSLVVCTGVACASGALAAPKKPAPAAPAVSAQAQHKKAAAQYGDGNYQQALELIAQGLAVAPKDLKLLTLKGRVLLELRDYTGALAAWEAVRDAAEKGRLRDEAEKIVEQLLAVRTTSLEIAVTNGPADIYLDSKTLGVFCKAAPSCNQPVLPGQYKVIAERPGFKRAAKDLAVESGKSTKLDLTLTEDPSRLTVRVAPEGATVMIDGAAFDPAKPIAAGKHALVASLAGHGEERREVEAREGKPIELDIVLSPIVPVQIETAGAELFLGGKPVALQDGGIPLPAGAQTVVARAQGFQERKIEVPAERPADYKLVVKLEPVVVVAPPPPTPGIFTGRRKIALVAGGVGVAALGAGIVLGRNAGQLDDDAYALCASPSIPCADALEANDLNQRARDRALQANIAFGVAGGAAIAAAILWFTGAPESPVAVTPRFGSRFGSRVGSRVGAAAGLDVTVRF